MNIKQFIILVLLIVNFALSKKLRSNAAPYGDSRYVANSGYGYGSSPYGNSVYGGGSPYGSSGYRANSVYGGGSPYGSSGYRYGY